MDEDDIRRAVAPVLVNASSFPRKVQPYILGQDMSGLIARVVSAVVRAEEDSAPRCDYDCGHCHADEDPAPEENFWDDRTTPHRNG